MENKSLNARVKNFFKKYPQLEGRDFNGWQIENGNFYIPAFDLTIQKKDLEELLGTSIQSNWYSIYVTHVNGEVIVRIPDFLNKKIIKKAKKIKYLKASDKDAEKIKSLYREEKGEIISHVKHLGKHLEIVHNGHNCLLKDFKGQLVATASWGWVTKKLKNKCGGYWELYIAPALFKS